MKLSDMFTPPDFGCLTQEKTSGSYCIERDGCCTCPYTLGPFSTIGTGLSLEPIIGLFWAPLGNHVGYAQAAYRYFYGCISPLFATFTAAFRNFYGCISPLLRLHLPLLRLHVATFTAAFRHFYGCISKSLPLLLANYHFVKRSAAPFCK